MNMLKKKQLNKKDKPSAGGGRFSFGAWWEKNTGEPLKTGEKVVAILLLIVFLFVFYVTLDANKYPIQVQIVEGEGRSGVNPTTEALDFGDLSRGSTVVRRVELQNGTFMPVFVMVMKTGSISELVDIDKNYFKLVQDEETKIEFTNYVPASAEIGRTYDGRVYIFKVPTFGL